ncbi:unnamed protein product [Lepidochelys kempii]
MLGQSHEGLWITGHRTSTLFYIHWGVSAEHQGEAFVRGISYGCDSQPSCSDRHCDINPLVYKQSFIFLLFGPVSGNVGVTHAHLRLNVSGQGPSFAKHWKTELFWAPSPSAAAL